MLRILALLCACLVLSLLGCSPAATPTPPPPTPDGVATETRIAAKIFSTQTASAPTATSTLTPTDTPSATPTATLTRTVIPTHTATQTPSPISVKDAFAKSQKASAFHIDLEVRFKDEIQDVVLLSANIDARENAQHSFLKGYLTKEMGLDPNKRSEMIDIGNQRFVRGPIPNSPANQEKWYLVPLHEAEPLTSGPSNLFDLNESSFEWTATETLDARLCDIYTGGTETSLEFMKGSPLLNGDVLTLDRVEDATTRVYACTDGYIHFIGIEIHATNPNDATQKESLTLFIHAHRYGAILPIKPPEDYETLTTQD